MNRVTGYDVYMTENWIDDAFLENRKISRWDKDEVYDHHNYYANTMFEDDENNENDYIDYDNLDMSIDEIYYNREMIDRIFRFFNGRETYSSEEMITYVRNGEYYEHVGNTRCCKEHNIKTNTTLRKEFDKELQDVHDDDIVRFGGYFGKSNNMLFLCNRCGTLFCKEGRHVIQYGCSKCDGSEGYKGENKVKELLDKNDIYYLYQNSDGCINHKTNKCLIFDFIVPIHENKFYIEVHGEQHYCPVDFFGGEDEFEYQQFKDVIKRKHAENNGVYVELDYREHDISKLEERFYEKFLNKYIKKGENTYE